MPLLDIQGTPFHYQQDGTGPDVMLIHAFTGNMAVWALSGITAALAGDYRVTTYDLRGHGMSGVTRTGYDSLHMARDCWRLHQALGLGQAHLVGHSFGGVIAMHAALEYPHAVKSIVLSDSYFPGLRNLEPNMGQAGVWTDLRAQLAEVGSDIGESVDFGRLFRTAASWSPGEQDQVAEVMGPAGARWLCQLGQLAETEAGQQMFVECGLTAERIVQVEQPVTALYDEYSPFEATREFLESRLPNCRAATVPGAKHLAPVQNPTALVELVQEHLKWAGG